MKRLPEATRVRHDRAAGLCSAVYGRPNDITFAMLAATLRSQVLTYSVFGTGDVKALVVIADDRIVVVFRGTVFANKTSAVRNLKASLVSDGGWYRTHDGYAWGLDTIWQRLRETLDELQSAYPRPVSIIGHSQGGALAALFAARLCHATEIMPDQLTTFAAPRVGDVRFAGTMQAIQTAGCECTRYTSTNDVVPHLPPAAFGYEHGIDETYIDRNANVIRNPWNLNRWYDGLVERFRTPGVFDSIAGHSIDTYKAKLHKVFE